MYIFSLVSKKVLKSDKQLILDLRNFETAQIVGTPPKIMDYGYHIVQKYLYCTN